MPDGWQTTHFTHLVTIVSKHLTEQFSQWQEAKERQQMETEKGRPVHTDFATDYSEPRLVPLESFPMWPLGGDKEGLKAGGRQTLAMDSYPTVRLG